MKIGNISSLVEMATELERRAEAKKDFIAPTTKLMVRDDGNLFLGERGLVPTDHFRRQVATHYKVPAEYAERIRASHPQLYAETFNTFLQREPATRMIRTIDGKARAFLSDRFRPLDNHDLANAILPSLMEQSAIQIMSMDISDNKFYLKAVFPRIQTEIRRGDVVQIGLAIGNSETGDGALSVMPLIYTLACTNGMITVSDFGARKAHLGRRNTAENNIEEFLTDQTRRLDDAAFFAKTRDVVKGILSDLTLEKIAQRMRDATEQKLDVTKITEIVEVTATKFGYNDTTKGGILANLIKGGDFTRYGLMNAVTRQAQDEADYQMATQLEMDGGKIIELARTDWQTIAEAA
jgi:hypothetical protein